MDEGNCSVSFSFCSLVDKWKRWASTLHSDCLKIQMSLDKTLKWVVPFLLQLHQVRPVVQQSSHLWGKRESFCFHLLFCAKLNKPNASFKANKKGFFHLLLLLGPFCFYLQFLPINAHFISSLWFCSFFFSYFDDILICFKLPFIFIFFPSMLIYGRFFYFFYALNDLFVLFPLFAQHLLFMTFLLLQLLLLLDCWCFLLLCKWETQRESKPNPYEGKHPKTKSFLIFIYLY